MKIIVLWFIICAAVPANDIYIAQTAQGGNTGVDCADAFVYTYFNTPANWSGAPNIGDGTTVHVCGTFTFGAAQGTVLQFQW